jgi:hypothetical protein
MIFDYLKIPVDYGPGVGVRPFRILPWFASNADGKNVYTVMYFAATVAREGRIHVGKNEYDALLAQPYAITGRFDGPGTALYLTPTHLQDGRWSWGWGMEQLSGMQQVDGQLYTITATPLGDKLTVTPYRGDFGVFEIGPGGRNIKDIALQGSLRSLTKAVGVGPEPTRFAADKKKARTCKVPVGDYVPSYLTIEYGTLQIGISDNYHSEGRPRDMERRRTYGIKIRKDKPFVLDFSHKPEVIFANPAKDKTFQPGDEIQVAAVLVDPALDVMIRRLTDSVRKTKATYKLSNGKETSYERPLSLDPEVTITDAAGKIVAEGPMPFG